MEMDQSFVVSLARFHRTASDIYVLQGFFLCNTIGDSRFTAVLDGRNVPVRVSAREGLAVRQKYFARGVGFENIDREYDVWIELPKGWESGRTLRVYQNLGQAAGRTPGQTPEQTPGQTSEQTPGQTSSGARKSVYRVSVRRLLRERALPDGYLETFRIEADTVYVGGWAVGNGPCRFRVEDGGGNRLTGKVTRHYRQDILDTYPEIAEEARQDAAASQQETKGSRCSTSHASEGTQGSAPQEQAQDLRFGYELSFPRPASDTVTIIIGTRTQRMRQRLNLRKGLGRGGLQPSVFQKTGAYFKRYGLGRTLRRAGQKLQERMTGQRESYMSWRRHILPSQDELEAQRAQRFDVRPLFSIVVPLYRTDQKLLSALVESVQAQTYDNWELCLSDGSGADSPLRAYLHGLQQADPRIRIIDTGRKLGIAGNTDQALSIARGDFIAFADHDDLLPPWALYECAKEINAHPETMMLYSDEDKVTMDGKEYFQPHFKSDFNIDLLTSMNYFCHLVVVSRELLAQPELGDNTVRHQDADETSYEGDAHKINGEADDKSDSGIDDERQGRWFDPSYDGAQDYDFVLRCVERCLESEAGAAAIRHIPKVLYHWRSHPASTSENPASKRYAFEAGQRAVQAHFDRIGVDAKVEMGAYPGLYRVRYAIPAQEPLVSIIIPNKDHVEDLRKCVASILERSAYRHFEFVIVENGSETEEIFAYYKACEEKYDNFRVLTWTEGFNYSAINNFGAAQARGDYLLFLNNDTEMTDPDLLSELVGPCLRDEVGAVGARLFYEDGTIQHAGVIIGYGGIAGHAFQGMGGGENGYFSRIICQSDLSAVTAACMLVRREAFEKVGGFDPLLAVAFNDIDFCLRLRREGYLVVYNPFAVMTHYESKSRGMEDTPEKIARFNREADILLKRWAALLKSGDPYYNPNLSLDRVDFGLKKL